MSASYMRKYGTGTGADIYINIPKAGSANHAVSADWTPAAGDVKISKDGGAAANIGTLPTAIAMGNSTIWKFVFADAELQAAFISVTVSDSATKAVDDTGFSIETYGNASALHAFDLDTATQSVSVTQWSGTNVAAVDTAGYPKVTIKAGSGTGEVSLSSGAVTVGTNNDKTGYAIGAGGIAAAAFAAGAIDASAIAADAIGSSELAATAANEIADALLARNIAGGSSAGRIVSQALYVLRNRVAIAAGTATVYEVDDSTASWTAAVTTTAGDPISEVNPA